MAEEDLNKIAVQLSLLSGEDSAAAQSLTKELKNIAGLFETINASFATYSTKLLKLSKQLEESSSTAIPKTSTDTSTAEAAAASAAALSTTTSQTREVLRQRQEETWSKNESDLKATQQAERERMARDSATPTGGAPVRFTTTATGSGSQPPSPEQEPPPSEPFKIPQFGRLTIQDYFREAETAAKKLAERGGRGSEVAGRMAPYLGKGAAAVGALYGVGKLAQSASGVTKPIFAAGDAGGALGYDRTDAGSFLGIQNPFSSAGEEGFRQKIDKFGLKLQSGINGEQAGAIVDATAGAGFSGQRAHDISYNLLAPLMKKYGLDPETIIPFTAAIRTGQNSVQELTDSLKNVGDAAKSASMTVADTTQALQAQVESSKAQGNANTARAIGTGTQFMQLTGLGADVGAKMDQSGMVQAVTSSMYGGLPPFAQGLLNPDLKNEARFESIRRLEQTIGRGRKSFTVGTGAEKQTISATDYADSIIAPMLGVDTAELKKMKEIIPFERGARTALSDADNYRNSFYGQKHSALKDNMVKSFMDEHAGEGVSNVRADPITGVITYTDKSGTTQTEDFSKRVGGLGAGGRGRGGPGANETKGYQGTWKQMQDQAGKDAQRMIEHSQSHDGRTDWGELMHRAEASGIFGGKTRAEKTAAADKVLKGEAYQGKTVEQRVAQFQKDVRAQMKKAKDDPQVAIAFTGAASQWFKGIAKGNWSDVSGPETAASSRGPNPLPQPPAWMPRG